MLWRCFQCSKLIILFYRQKMFLRFLTKSVNFSLKVTQPCISPSVLGFVHWVIVLIQCCCMVFFRVIFQNWIAYNTLPFDMMAEQRLITFPNDNMPLYKDNFAFCQVRKACWEITGSTLRNVRVRPVSDIEPASRQTK